MANGTVTTTPKTPTTTGVNWGDYQKKIQTAAAATRQTGQPSAEGVSAAEQAASKLKGTRGDLGKAAVENYKIQQGAQQKQAEKAASALEMVGGATQRSIQGLEGIQQSVRQTTRSANEAWNSAAEQANEYVKASKARVGEVLTKLDKIHDDFNKERSFAKAHDMQATVQATIGSMRNEERNILETFGADSPEFQQFQASKRSALATVQSNIHASYQKIKEDQNTAYLGTVSDAMTKSNMYLGFQEQQHVEMLKYRDQAKTSYALQAAQMDATLEQMKMSGMENMANWLVETPSFTMDMTPLMGMLNDLSEAQTAEEEAAAEAAGQPSKWVSYQGAGTGKTMWKQVPANKW